MKSEAASGSYSAHTFGPDCPDCGDGRSGTNCDLSGYTARRVRFILAHRAAYESAYLNPNRSAASSEQERLEREYRTLPPRHNCSCHCPFERRGYPRCVECKRLDDQRPKGPDVAVSIGRTSHVHAPMPSPVMLDLARAEDVLGKTDDATAIARYMSVDGAANDPQTRPTVPSSRRPSTIVEMGCLMCARSAAPGQRCCQWCGGSLVAEEALTL